MDHLQEIKYLLDLQKTDIQKLICKVRTSRNTSEQGSLILSGNANNKSFYYRAAHDAPLQYLSRKGNEDRIRQLAQQEYDEKLLAAAEKQVLALQKASSLLSDRELERVYESLPSAKQALIKPLYPDRERFIREWAAVTYPPAKMGKDVPECYSERGEHVRSKSEKIIADKYLHLDAVEYRYEYPLILLADGVKVIFRPDFMLLNKRTCRIFYHQHLGRMDDPDYVADNLRKLRIFEQNGIFLGEHLFFTYETKQEPFDDRTLDPLIRRYLL